MWHLLVLLFSSEASWPGTRNGFQGTGLFAYEPALHELHLPEECLSLGLVWGTPRPNSISIGTSSCDLARRVLQAIACTACETSQRSHVCRFRVLTRTLLLRAYLHSGHRTATGPGSKRPSPSTGKHQDIALGPAPVHTKTLLLASFLHAEHQQVAWGPISCKERFPSERLPVTQGHSIPPAL